MAQQEIFRAASSARRTISRNAYLFFAVGVTLLICSASVIAITFAGEPPASPVPVVVGIGIGGAGLVGLIAGLVTLTRVRQSMQVEVTPYRLTWREGKRLAILEYEEVVRVDLVRDQQRHRDGVNILFPVVRFIENDDEVMEFEVTFEDRGRIHPSRFDARAITAAVLPHLPDHVVISPTLTDFVQTGEVDIDLLPER